MVRSDQAPEGRTSGLHQHWCIGLDFSGEMGTPDQGENQIVEKGIDLVGMVSTVFAGSRGLCGARDALCLQINLRVRRGGCGSDALKIEPSFGGLPR